MTPKQLQAAFFAQIADPQALRGMFEHLPDVYFFVKDRESRLIAASSTILPRLGMKTEAEFIGKMDHEVFPQVIAAAYRADDQRVFRTGKPLVNRLELWFSESRQLVWGLTTKIPLRGRKGKIIGLMGMTRRDTGRNQSALEDEAGRAAAYLQKSTHRVMTTRELAQAMAVSERTLNRRINAAFGVSPYELMLRTRIQNAAETLLHRPTESITDIALSHGFCDQSTFTQHFRKRTGMTPKKFREWHDRSFRAA